MLRGALRGACCKRFALGSSDVTLSAVRLSRREWRSVGGMATVVVGLHLVGWITLVAVVAPAHYTVGGQVFGIGLGVTAYTLGMQHAFDADHIAAIDNTTRKLMAEGKRPMSVGLFFSLGHSTIVFGLALLFAAGVHGLGGQTGHAGSTLHNVAGSVGTG